MEYVYLLKAKVKDFALAPFSKNNSAISLGYFSSIKQLKIAADGWRDKIIEAGEKLGIYNINNLAVTFEFYSFLVDGCSYCAEKDLEIFDEFDFSIPENEDDCLEHDLIDNDLNANTKILNSIYVLQAIWGNSRPDSFVSSLTSYVVGCFSSYDTAFAAIKEMCNDYKPFGNNLIEEVLKHNLKGFRMSEVTLNSDSAHLNYIINPEYEYNFSYSSKPITVYAFLHDFMHEIEIGQLYIGDIVEFISDGVIQFGIVEKLPIPYTVVNAMKEANIHSDELENPKFYSIIDLDGFHLRVKPTDIFIPYGVPDEVQDKFDVIRSQHNLYS
jgi:hypothetical protein